MKHEELVAHPVDGLRRRRSRRWPVWLAVLLSLGLFWLAVICLFFVYWTDRDLREATAAAERDSPNGWQLENLEAHRDRVPDDQNAALVVLKIKSLLPANWPQDLAAPAPASFSAGAYFPPRPWEERFASLSPEVQLDAEMLRSLRDSLARVVPARDEARKLIGMTRGRFPLVWTGDLLLLKLQSLDARIAANLLRHEAALAAQLGDADRAVASVRGLLAAARSVGDEPLLLSMITRLVCDTQAVETLERSLAQGEPSAEELVAVQKLLEQEAEEPLLLQAVRGERAAMHQVLLSLRQRTASLAQAAGARGAFERMLVEVSGPTLARRSHGSILRLLNEYVDAAKLPLEKQEPVMQNLQQRVIQARQQFDVVTAALMPALTRVAERYRRGVGGLRCALVGVSLERYRHDHGGWPETLDALVPNYLPAVPTDPHDGKPLRFKRRLDGIVVYSLGSDGEDHGGKLNRQTPWAKGSDQGFQLWDVIQRRQPPREPLPVPREEVVP